MSNGGKDTDCLKNIFLLDYELHFGLCSSSITITVTEIRFFGLRIKLIHVSLSMKKLGIHIYILWHSLTCSEPWLLLSSAQELQFGFCFSSIALSVAEIHFGARRGIELMIFIAFN